MKKRILSFALVLCMVVTLLPVSVYANGKETDDFVRVYSVADLYCVRYNLAGNYILMNDIDLTEATAFDGDWCFETYGWLPIGCDDTYGYSSFSGLFDGNGHTISGMQISAHGKRLGLFASVSGTVQNLTMSGCKVKCTYNNFDGDIFIGTIAGETTGTVSNCAVCDGSVELQSNIYGFAGGIVGRAAGSTIECCYNTSDVSATLNSNKYVFAAGIAGTAENTTFLNCYNAGKITTRNDYSLSYNYGHAISAGIVSSVSGTTTAKCCYNTGRLSAVAASSSSNSSRYAIAECTLKNCYFLKDTGSATVGAMSLTAEQAKIKLMYSGFDFENVWMLNNNISYPYPQLRNNMQVECDHSSLTKDVAVPATCTESGLTEGSRCTFCDKVVIPQTVVPATGHKHEKVVFAPTCTAKGYTTYTCACGDRYIDDYVDALGHDWQAPVFTWAADNSCKAKFVCSRGDAAENVNCTVTYKTTDASYTVAGTTVYTAKVTFNGKTYTDTKTVVGELATHSYDTPVYEWNDDYTSCVGKRFCQNEGCTDCFSEEGSITAKVTKEPTCEAVGEKTVRAIFNCKAFYTQEVKLEIKALGHNYVDGICTRCKAKDPNYVIPNPFTDVSENAAYYDAVMWGNSKGIVSGFTATEFRPNNTCTRAQVVTFLWRAAGSPEPTSSNNPFSDVSAVQTNGKANPFYKAILWGVENGITTGYNDGTFRPNATVTRGQFVTFLWRYEGKPTSGTELNFNDTNTIAKGYLDAVAWGVENGVIAGYGDGTFRPNATCTRWQVVLFMYRDMA